VPEPAGAPTTRLEQFFETLRLFERDRLIGIGTAASLREPGFVLVIYRNRDRADLLWRGRRIGRVQWTTTGLIFDPELLKGQPQGPFGPASLISAHRID